MGIVPFVYLWHSSKKMGFFKLFSTFKSNILPEDDVTVKTRCDSTVKQFSHRLQKSYCLCPIWGSAKPAPNLKGIKCNFL